MADSSNPYSKRLDGVASIRAGIAAAVIGNMIEFYDFTVYTFFAVSIGKVFFPTRDGLESLLLSVATFGVGFFTRPLGAMVIGAYADRAGRKPALMLTVGLMALGMLLLALTPGYATLGVAAPILVVAGRLIQGFALGGDVGPSTAFLIEYGPARRRGFFGAWQIASQGGATLLAGLVGVALSVSLPADAMQAWGWRIALLVGVLVVPAGVLMRATMPETLSSEASGAAGAGRQLGNLLAAHGRVVVLGVLICMGATIGTYTSTYLTTYALTTLHLSQSIAIGATVVVGFCTLGGALLGGWLSDRWGRKRVAAISRAATSLLVYPAFVAMSRYQSPLVFYAMAAVITVPNAISGGVGVVFISENFPRAMRSIGLAITYALGISVFGGTTQFVITWLIGSTGNPLSPAWYVAGTGVLALAATLMLPDPAARAYRATGSEAAVVP